MWTNVSWGRYWAWDPKETWALTTLLLYAVALHRGMRFFPRSTPMPENFITLHIMCIFHWLTLLKK